MKLKSNKWKSSSEIKRPLVKQQSTSQKAFEGSLEGTIKAVL